MKLEQTAIDKIAERLKATPAVVRLLQREGRLSANPTAHEITGLLRSSSGVLAVGRAKRDAAAAAELAAQEAHKVEARKASLYQQLSVAKEACDYRRANEIHEELSLLQGAN
jgi:hypothetical protein